MNLRELIERQNQIVSAARAAGRGMTAEEVSEFDNLQRQIDAIRAASPAGTGTPAPATPQEGARGAQPEHHETAPDGADPEATQRAVAAERERIREITDLCSEFGLEARTYIDNNSSVEAVRAAVIAHMRTEHAPVNARGIEVTDSEQDKFRRAASDALLMRSNISVEKPAEGARDLRGLSLRDLAIECLTREGQSAMDLIRMDRNQLYDDLCRQFYNPTAAFPAIMDETIRKSIITMYNSVPTTFQAWTTAGTLPDFKQTTDHEYVFGGDGDFLLVPENGELKPSMPETKLLPQRKLDTYGRQFSMTRQAFINDDIGFLTQMPGWYATKAKKTIDKQVYQLLFSNSKIFDNKTLFCADHKNLVTTGSKPTQASIQEIILQMQKQTDQFGEPIYMTPQYLIVPVGYEFDLAVIMKSAQVVGSANNDINPLYNYPLTIIQTPVLNSLAKTDAAPWFLVANSASARGIQVDYLNGQQTPTIRRMEQPGVLGFTWDIYLDWGVAVRDYRGIAKNPGVAIS